MMYQFYSLASLKQLAFLFFAAGMISLIPACDKDDAQTDAEKEFSEYLKEVTEQYASAFGDTSPGIFLAVYTPSSFEFYDYGFQQEAGPDVHFRGASTTKSFTAASILWLHQNGLLDINDHITDLIPGRDSAYLPNTPLFDIPFKSGITISML